MNFSGLRQNLYPNKISKKEKKKKLNSELLFPRLACASLVSSPTSPLLTPHTPLFLMVLQLSIFEFVAAFGRKFNYVFLYLLRRRS